MSSKRSSLIALIEQGLLPPDKVQAALDATKFFPDNHAWRLFADKLLLSLGCLALAFSLMFFIAYNWYELGRFFKFALVEVALVASVTAYWFLQKQETFAKIILLVSCIFLGVLLALYGQTYQTGADPWQLFFNWALLILPWAIISRFSVIWVFWLLLINVSVVLYTMTFSRFFGLVFGNYTGIIWVLFAINSLALCVWELLSLKITWLEARWAVRLLATICGYIISWLTIISIFNSRSVGSWTGIFWLAFMAALFYVYRYRIRDLYMLAGVALSSIVVVVCFFAERLFDFADEGAFLLLTIIVIGMGAGSAMWLRKIHQEWQS